MAKFTATLIDENENVYPSPPSTGPVWQKICLVHLIFSEDEFERRTNYGLGKEIFDEIMPTIKDIADRHFFIEEDDASIHQIITRITLENVIYGSLELTISVMSLFAGIYQFFRNYPRLRKGAIMFVEDLQAHAPSILTRARTVFRR
jgi:hypothetical protein